MLSMYSKRRGNTAEGALCAMMLAALWGGILSTPPMDKQPARKSHRSKNRTIYPLDALQAPSQPT